MKAETKTVTVVPGLYHHLGKDRFYHRPQIDGTGRRSWRWLKARTKDAARKEFYSLGKAGVDIKAASVIQAYDDAGCPGAKRKPRTPEFLTAERARCVMLRDFFGTMKAAQVTIGHCQQYHDWRVRKLTKDCAGGRTVDMDLTTASNAFRWATLNGTPPMMLANPWATGRPRYADPEHCRNHCCESGDELHRVAAAMGGIIALQFLFECTSGCRTGEALPLRRDAKPGRPGYILTTEDGKRWLCIARLKQRGEGDDDYILITPALELVLAEINAYHAGLNKRSVWYFPGRDMATDNPVDEGSLSHALKRKVILDIIGNDKDGEPRKLTSHGCRAFYVTWRRSTPGVTDAQVAAEIGHQGGVRLLHEVYGKKLPAYAKGGFSPFPTTVEAFWKNAPATRFATNSEPTPAIPGHTPAHSNAQPENVIVLPQNNLTHSYTR